MRRLLLCELFLALSCLFLTGLNSSGQLIEVRGEVEVINIAKQLTNGFSVRCVVGTNTWLIHTDFLTNAERTWWFIGSNIARLTVITKQLQPPKRIPGHVISYGAPLGKRYLRVFQSIDGHPIGDLGDKLPWLAFCSGPYLKQPGRQIPLPDTIGDWDAFGYKDETVLFDDGLGLPKAVSFFTPDGDLKCEYRVLQSTNVLNWNMPLHFESIQYRGEPDTQLFPTVRITGRVLSITPVPKLLIPEDAELLENGDMILTPNSSHKLAAEMFRPVDPFLSLTLNTGLYIFTSQIHVSATYLGLLEGVPSDETNEMILSWIPDRYRQIFGRDCPIYLIPPLIERWEGPHPHSPGRIQKIAKMPQIEIGARFVTAGGMDPEEMPSHLVIVWHQEKLGLTLADAIKDHIAGIDWKKYAQDFDY